MEPDKLGNNHVMTSMIGGNSLTMVYVSLLVHVGKSQYTVGSGSRSPSTSYKLLLNGKHFVLTMVSKVGR